MAFVKHDERLRAPAWWWLLVLLLVVTAAVAVFAYVSPPVGIAVTLFFLVGLSGILIGYGSLRVRVDQDQLQVGRFRIESRWIAGAEVVEGQAARDLLGAGADRRDFLLTRPYIDGVVRVRLDDPADPHPHWIISTRRPQQLADAIEQLVRSA